MANFSDYIKNQNTTNTTQNKTSDKNLNQDDLENLINKYSTYNQNDLMNEFMKLTYEKKKNGELSSSDIDNLKQTMMPFLNDEQKQNLDKILSMVKDV